jgi:hypothetical protein
MTAPVRTPLGDAALARDYYIDVFDSTAGSGGAYIAVMGVQSIQVQFEPNWADDSDNDSGGFSAQTKTGEKVTVTCKLRRAPSVATPTTYDPGQEVIRKAGPGKQGSANRVKCRVYEMGTARVEAYEGFFGVDWQEDGGGTQDLRMISLVLQGKGAAKPITHPQPAA